MAEADARAVLEALCRERGEDYAGLSEMLGRNPAYIQQFIRRGVPKRLGEADRARLAAYFGIPEHRLGGPSAPTLSDIVAVPRLEIEASAGPGGTGEAAGPAAAVRFDRAWLRDLTGGRADDLSMIRVAGESMRPTLADGDDILVDHRAARGPLRDGIYVLRRDDALLVKRIALEPGRGVSIRSDNRDYPSWDGCDPASLDVVGRVIWAGRRIA